MRQWRKNATAEFKEIMKMIDIDYRNSTNKDKIDFSLMKEKVIKGHLIMMHTYLEYLFTEKINANFFRLGNSHFAKAMHKNKKIKLFNHYVLEKLTFKEKFELVKQIYSISITDHIYKNIEKFNEMRNLLAHWFSLEISHKHQGKNSITYKNQDILSVRGLTVLVDDIKEIFEHMQ
ncbi:MAG TPA: hypothetical protein PKC14_04385 [Candidatus Absconditabacterales bacterium]|nr:hypothetical protein [Candidatus Absconditabacterales bacterium]